MAGNLTAMIAAIFSGSAVSTDPYFNLTTLLLSTTATNGQQNNTFLDSSTNNFTITRNPATGPNAPTQGTFSPFSQTGWGNYFDGSGDSLVPVSANTANAMGTGDWTFETWVYKIGTGQESIFDTLAASGGTTDAIRIRIDASASGGAILFFRYSAVVTSGGTVTLNTWNHIALVRQSGTLKIYLNGTQVNTTYNDSGVNYTCGASRPIIGIDGFGGTSNAFTGYISNLRTVKGTAVYTGNFTPPTAPLTAITNTALLTCQSNRFVDNSSNNFTITPNGNTSVVPFSPFNPTSAWSASTVGGSGYFDGTGDYLNTPATGQFAPTGDFTIRLWFYLTSLAATNHLIGNLDANSGTDWLIEVINTGVIQVFTNGFTLRLSHSGVTTNQWYYVTVTRSGTTITGQVNGANFNTVSTYTQAGTFGTATKAIYIGRRAGGTNPLTGYLSSVSLVDGSALQTVPTAPLTNVSGTQLLLNFNNSGIYDATAKNVLETVGNAQVSTTQSKWSPTSMSFNGTTDYLQVNTASDLYNLSSGNWTIEAWVYRTGTNQMSPISYLNGSGTTLSGWSIEVNRTSAGTLYFASYNASTSPSGSVISAGNVVPLNAWTYIAVTCVGTTVTLYANGVNVGSGAMGTIGNDSSCRLRIGGMNYTIVRYWQGYIQDPRITKGVARTITTPTAAFPVQ